MLDLARLQNGTAVPNPFPHIIVPNFVAESAFQAIENDFPNITKGGSFPLASLSCGPAFMQFMDVLQGKDFREAIAAKLGLNLENRPTMITVRGQARAKDGKIHTDSKTKLVTVLIYMNGDWEDAGGRLRLLRSADNLDDCIAEVPPERGTLLAFVNTPNAWHGHAPFEGQRRSIQLNWVTDAGVVWREQMRHKIFAFFKNRKAV